jgi:hypothetical protein
MFEVRTYVGNVVDRVTNLMARLKSGEFLEQLKVYRLLKKDFVPRSLLTYSLTFLLTYFHTYLLS